MSLFLPSASLSASHELHTEVVCVCIICLFLKRYVYFRTYHWSRTSCVFYTNANFLGKGCVRQQRTSFVHYWVQHVSAETSSAPRCFNLRDWLHLRHYIASCYVKRLVRRDASVHCVIFLALNKGGRRISSTYVSCYIYLRDGRCLYSMMHEPLGICAVLCTNSPCSV